MALVPLAPMGDPGESEIRNQQWRCSGMEQRLSGPCLALWPANPGVLLAGLRRQPVLAENMNLPPPLEGPFCFLSFLLCSLFL